MKINTTTLKKWATENRNNFKPRARELRALTLSGSLPPKKSSFVLNWNVYSHNIQINFNHNRDNAQTRLAYIHHQIILHLVLKKKTH